MISEIYKTFCQSILLYGLEIFNFSNGTINELNIRQNILIKLSIGLAKFVKTTPLSSPLRIKSIKHLVYQHKLCFVRQLYNVNFTRSIFKYLEDFYKLDVTLVDSFFKSYKKIIATCRIQENALNKTKINEKLSEHFTYQMMEWDQLIQLKQY
jgi:hypothetical protein